jgi:tetratricopeptide (TPR) repeat protein
MKDDESPDAVTPNPEAAAEEDAPSEGYAWGYARQERELPEQDYVAHIRLLDEIDEEALETLDLADADDYLLWAAAQAFEELERDDDAIALLKRIAASTSSHPALYYPDILFRLEDMLKDRGHYGEALSLIDRVEQSEPGLRDRCNERRAEIMVLRGEPAEGLRLFQETARAFPDDPWVPLRAAWALLASGRYAEVVRWIETSEEALKEVKDEEEAREAASEIDRLRREAVDRQARSTRLESEGTEAVPGLEAVKEEILAALDAEEARLTGNPPRTEDARSRATERLAVLRERASKGWDDAVEARDETLIAEFDELQWDVVGLAERFAIELPGVEAE